MLKRSHESVDFDEGLSDRAASVEPPECVGNSGEVGARADQRGEVRATGHPGDPGAEDGRNLDGETADPARCSDDGSAVRRGSSRETLSAGRTRPSTTC